MRQGQQDDPNFLPAAHAAAGTDAEARCLARAHWLLTHPSVQRLSLVFVEAFGITLYSMMQAHADPLWDHQSLSNQVGLSLLIAGLATATYSHANAVRQTHVHAPEAHAKKISHGSAAVAAACFVAFAIQRLTTSATVVDTAQLASLMTGVAAYLLHAGSHIHHQRQQAGSQKLEHVQKLSTVVATGLALAFGAFVVLKASGYDIPAAINIGNDVLTTAAKRAGQATLAIAVLANVVNSWQKRHADARAHPMPQPQPDADRDDVALVQMA
jgi:hypothetical protein